MSAVKSEIMENATNVENVGSWPFGQEFLCVDKIPQTGIFLAPISSLKGIVES